MLGNFNNYVVLVSMDNIRSDGDLNSKQIFSVSQFTTVITAEKTHEDCYASHLNPSDQDNLKRCLSYEYLCT